MSRKNDDLSLTDRAKNFIKSLSKRERILWCAAAASVAALIVLAASLSGGPAVEKSSVASIAPRSSSSSSSGSSSVSSVRIESHTDEIAAAAAKNPDTIGWLKVPGLSEIDKPVVQSTESNKYYLYRDASGNKLTNNLTTGYHILGAFYTHYRDTFGTRDELSTNTVIFGHSDLGLNKNYADDDPTGTLFSQLYNFLDEDFAKKTPYIYFSTAKEDMVWEVFAVGYSDSGTDYIEPDPQPTAYAQLLEDAKARSQFDYGVDVGPGDKILTLSTCTIHFGMTAKSEYRFVVTAKLIDTDAATKKTADLTVNEDIDPDYKG